MSLPFLKMNGLGNDFVIVPADGEPFVPGPSQARAIADRAGDLGCDQIIAISRSVRADARMRIWNADGGEVSACGNAARCVGWLVMEASGLGAARIETSGGVIEARRSGSGRVTVDLGEPGLDWRDIPLAWEMDTLEIDLVVDSQLKSPSCVSMGNPHMVFFVPKVDTTPVNEVGPRLEHHWLFPERANVGFAEIVSANRIRLKVWERGVGQTQACGTGACAALVAAHRRGLCGRSAILEMNGGDLFVEWRQSDNHVLMTGPVTLEFIGLLPSPEVAAAPTFC
jgi:diaminopimelate epimerase